MASLLFSWHAPQHDNALFYRLYDNAALIVDDIGEINFTLIDVADGDHSYYVTAVDVITRRESDPSATIGVNIVKPLAPLDFSLAFGGDS